MNEMDSTFSDLSAFSYVVLSESWADSKLQARVYLESTEMGLAYIDQRRTVRTVAENAPSSVSC